MRRVVRASVQRRRPRSSACASAHRPATARASFGASNGAPALRVELAPPVRSGAPPHVVRLASEAAKCLDGRPDASLEVSCPLQRSPATSRLYVPGGATSPAIPLRPLTRVVVLLRPWRSRSRVPRASCDARMCAPATPCTHAPATLAVLAVLRLAELARSTLRGSTPRVLAGTLRRSRRASLRRTRVRARRGSCAGAFLVSRRSATRGSGYVAWSGPFSAVEACLGFRPVNLAGNEAGLSSRV